ncbi:type III restriction-modification system endonuclease [Corynebacterium casei]|uniref:type III restriction-modification system endonuclease n=1 Tax=Corynebacterium casei TaxID=160386 RepID=UPI003FD4ECF2
MSNTVDIQLEQLPHQSEAINALMQVFTNVLPASTATTSRATSNPIFTQDRTLIESNVDAIQEANSRTIPEELRTRDSTGPFGIDVRMETGTGKTYVYTRTMYEMHRALGVNKFIVVVPGIAIKQGAVSFLSADYARRHFRDMFDDVDMSVHVVSPTKARSGRKIFPTDVWEFAVGDDPNRIYVLVVNQGMLGMSKTDSLNRDDYDQAILDVHTRPYNAIAATNPVVLLDEPHKFKKGNKAWSVISGELGAQLIVRYGATFPVKSEKKGQPPVIDYNNLIHNLTAVESFNRNLIKGVEAEYVARVDKDDTRFKVTGISRGTKTTKEVTFDIISTDPNTGKSISRDRSLKINDEMSALSPELSGLFIEDIVPTSGGASGHIVLSNDRVIHRGEIIYESAFSHTYQELMVEQAVRNHLDIEWEQYQRTNRIKALTLFFIDSIDSYRREDNTLGHLGQSFEKVLDTEIRKKITEVTKEHAGSPRAQEYVEYLEASLADLSATHGGYFSRDRSTKDEVIKEQIDKILNQKQEMISLRREDGSLNTMRFIFSKWTLREGWDNPNVFQIAKLRSSGSETSKLQEVGRGLRLPVDEHGTRVSGNEFYLRYLVDFQEQDFVDKLLNEVNADGGGIHLINIKALMNDVSEKLGIPRKKLFIQLMVDDFIDDEYNVNEDKRDEFIKQYPDFFQGVNEGKIKSKDDGSGKKSKDKITIRPQNYDKLKEVWEALNKKYVITLSEVSTETLDTAIDTMLSGIKVRDEEVTVTRKKTARDETTGMLGVEVSQVGTITLTDNEIPYGTFLAMLSDQTSLPEDLIHRGLVRHHKNGETVDSAFFTRRRVDDLTRVFKRWFNEYFDSHHQYVKVGATTLKTALTDDQGKPLKWVVRGDIGVFDQSKPGRKKDHSEIVKVPDTFLYDEVAWDSDIERRNIIDSSTIEDKNRIIVFGKIPRRSIRIPHYAGGTTSPDFMYVVEGADGSSVNFVIESKDYDNESSMREKEDAMKEQAKRFFDALNEDLDGDVPIDFHMQMGNDTLADIIKEHLK